MVVMRRKQLAEALEIEVPEPLRSCLMRLEVNCRIECCGIMALKPSAVLIEIWAESVGREKVSAALGQARAILGVLEIEKGLVACRFLNYRDGVGDEREYFRGVLRGVVEGLEGWV
jgi:hypothetical protein